MYGMILKFGVPMLVALFVWGAGQTYVKTYNANIQKVVELQREVDKRDGRLASYLRMIERRDAAIKASKCAPQIDKWVRNPEEIPKPFEPFNQLTPPNLR